MCPGPPVFAGFLDQGPTVSMRLDFGSPMQRGSVGGVTNPWGGRWRWLYNDDSDNDDDHATIPILIFAQ